MKIQPINNIYNSNFGANIKFANPKHADTVYSHHATELMERIKKMPDGDVIIEYIKGDSRDNSFLVAKNSVTGVPIKERVTKGDYLKESDNLSQGIGTTETFSRLLEAVLNPYYLIYKDFWYGEKQFEPAFNLNKSKRFVA